MASSDVGHELTILVVEDGLYQMGQTIGNVKKELEALDKHLILNMPIVENGTAALEYLERHTNRPPDLIILDIMMPSGARLTTPDDGRSTGAELYKVIRETMKMRIPIVVTTAVSDPRILAVFKDDPDVRLPLSTVLLSPVSWILSNS